MEGGKDLIHGLVKQTQFCLSFIALWSQNGSFQTPRCCQFINRSFFRSSTTVMNLGLWLKECYRKYKRKRWYFCEEFTAWHFVTKYAAVKFRKSMHIESFLRTERSHPRGVDHVTRMPQERSPSGCTHGKAAQRSTKDQMASLYLRPCLAPSWCGVSRAIWDCWKPWSILSRAAALGGWMMLTKVFKHISFFIVTAWFFVFWRCCFPKFATARFKHGCSCSGRSENVTSAELLRLFWNMYGTACDGEQAIQKRCGQHNLNFVF